MSCPQTNSSLKYVPCYSLSWQSSFPPISFVHFLISTLEFPCFLSVSWASVNSGIAEPVWSLWSWCLEQVYTEQAQTLDLWQMNKWVNVYIEGSSVVIKRFFGLEQSSVQRQHQNNPGCFCFFAFFFLKEWTSRKKQAKEWDKTQVRTKELANSKCNWGMNGRPFKSETRFLCLFLYQSKMGYFTSPNINSSNEKVVDERAEGYRGLWGFLYRFKIQRLKLSQRTSYLVKH